MANNNPFHVPAIMEKIKIIRDNEESLYSDIPEWNEQIAGWTDAAMLLIFPGRATRREHWMPYSQLRKSEDGLSVYASNWILEQKGLG